VGGVRPDALDLQGTAAPLQTVWVAVRANLRAVLEETTLADVARNDLPGPVRTIADAPGAWEIR
jgi:DNA-binding IscR family transcriptional regulator